MASPSPSRAGPWRIFHVRDARGTLRDIGMMRSWRLWPGSLKFVVLLCVLLLGFMQYELVRFMIADWGLRNSKVGGDNWYDLLLPAGAILVAMLVTIAGIVRISVPAVARRIFTLGMCPACRYSFRGLEPGPDRCTICPECGGAWGDQIAASGSAGPDKPDRNIP